MEIPQIINFKHTNSEKGLLAFAENSIKLPFELQRVYWITQVSDDVVRGGHAHYTSMQVIVCVRGSVEVQLEDMTGQGFDVSLSDPTRGLYIQIYYRWYARRVGFRSLSREGLYQRPCSL